MSMIPNHQSYIWMLSPEPEELPNLGLEERIDDRIDIEEGFVLQNGQIYTHI